jgi:hypothetical protein
MPHLLPSFKVCCSRSWEWVLAFWPTPTASASAFGFGLLATIVPVPSKIVTFAIAFESLAIAIAIAFGAGLSPQRLLCLTTRSILVHHFLWDINP